jgi:hypothetical protein
LRATKTGSTVVVDVKEKWRHAESWLKENCVSQPKIIPGEAKMTILLTVEESRAQFEAAASDLILDQSLFRPGEYRDGTTQQRWLGWELHRRTVSEGER